jgi:hypothetical protein
MIMLPFVYLCSQWFILHEIEQHQTQQTHTLLQTRAFHFLCAKWVEVESDKFKGQS